MSIITKAKDKFDEEIFTIARNNIIKKLGKAGIDYTELPSSEFDELVEDERKILEHDTKKVGMGIGIGIAISLLTGI